MLNFDNDINILIHCIYLEIKITFVPYTPIPLARDAVLIV
jgi:hypothetical protein